MFKVLCGREDGEIGRNEVGVFWTENRINALVVHITLYYTAILIYDITQK